MVHSSIKLFCNCHKTLKKIIMYTFCPFLFSPFQFFLLMSIISCQIINHSMIHYQTIKWDLVLSFFKDNKLAIKGTHIHARTLAHTWRYTRTHMWPFLLDGLLSSWCHFFTWFNLYLLKIQFSNSKKLPE